MHFLIHFLLRFLVFGVAITFACKKVKGVAVQPKAMLPVVAIVFALLNALLYGVVKFGLNVVSLWTLSIVAPVLVNAALLWVTDRLVKPFKIDGLIAFVQTTCIVTVAHIALRVIEYVVR
jgi:uncharacterized membrane protein YvlD (DUF360 family)